MPFGRGNGGRPGGQGQGGKPGGRRGRGGRRRGGGPPAECICPSCGHIVPHTPGTPCFQVSCPRCGTPMMARFRNDV